MSQHGVIPHAVVQVERESGGNLLDKRWAVTVLMAVAEGPVRFNQLARSTKINPNTLGERLRELEAAGVVERVVLSDFPPRVEYRLRREAHELREIMDRLKAALQNYH